MATQNSDLYDQSQIDAIRREFGVPMGERMADAIDETKDNVVEVTTSATEKAEAIISFIERGGIYFIAGFIFGVAATVVIRLLP